MVVHRTSLLFVLSLGCTFSGPVDDPEEASTSSATEANDDAIASGQSDDGHTSNTGAATGVSATASTSASSTTTANPTSADDASDDATASDTGTTGVGDTDSPREQCGIELPPGGGNYEAGCGCETCDLYWTDLDHATYQAIAAACECLCDAAGCGTSNSGEAAAAADSGGEEGTASDGTASTGTESTGE